MNFLLIGIGGAAGSVARYGTGKLLSAKTKTAFPVATFAVNILGAFLLGVVSCYHDGSNVFLLLGDGFLGAFTTFSTFMYEGVHLIKNNNRQNAAVYIGVSIVLGISGYIAGSFLGGIFISA